MHPLSAAISPRHIPMLPSQCSTLTAPVEYKYLLCLSQGLETYMHHCQGSSLPRHVCYTEKASPTRHRPERQHNARSNSNRRKQCSPNETKPYSKPTLPRKRQTKPGVGVVLFTHCNSDRLSPEQVLIRAQIATTQCDTLSYGRSRLLLCAHVHDGSFHDVIVHVLQLAHFLSSYTPLNRHHRSIMPLRPQTCTHSRVRAFGHVQC